MRQLQSQYYGGTAPPKPEGRRWGSAAPALAFLGGPAVYFLTAVLFSFLRFYHPNVVALVAAGALAASAGLISSRSQRPYFLPLGVCCGAAVLCGAVLGTYCYDTYGYFVYVYSNSRTYRNVVPEQSAMALADAGRLTFAREARIDQAASAGYMAGDGSLYCAAPIRGLAAGRRVEFWAVGEDCCSSAAGFECDGAGDAQARGGIVVFDGHGFFSKAARPYYDLARRKAEARGGLITVSEPLYVRWVGTERLDMLEAHCTRAAWLFIALSTLVFGCVSAGPAWALSRKPPAQGGRAT